MIEMQLFTIFSALDPMTKITVILILWVGSVAAIIGLVKSAIEKTGPFGAAISGGLSKLSQGVSQSQAKYRGGKRQENWGKFTSGQRNILGTRGLGERIGTFMESDSKGRLLRGRGWGEALSQQRTINAARMAKSDRGQAIQEDDDLLRALTYNNDEEALAGLMRETAAGGFGRTRAEAERAIRAVHASGGYGKNRQLWAAKQLFNTGTGYNGKDAAKQVAATAVRVAGNNESMAMDILGFGNAISEAKGRYDLKFGAGDHLRNYREARDNGGVLTDLTQSRSYAAAGTSFDGVSILRGKPDAQTNIAAGLTTAVNDATNFSVEQRADASEAINKIQQSASWASVGSVERVRFGVQGNLEQNAAIGTQSEAERNMDVLRDQATDEIVINTGLVDQNGRPITRTAENPVRHAGLAARRAAQRRGSMNNPDNPNIPRAA